MAYIVDNSGTEIQIDDGTLNTDTSLYLVGKNFAGYGEYIAQDLVWLLNNFASATPPLNPSPGQIWYNTETQKYSFYDPSAEFNTEGNGWGPLSLDTISKMRVMDVDEAYHDVTAVHDEGTIISIFSSESFAVNAADPIHPNQIGPELGFDYIGTGLTMTQNSKLFGTATRAEYADLAEMYASDQDYAPGTVVRIGGTAEVTQTASPYCQDVFGVVSTDPAYLMNSKTAGVPVALEGRVPCKVVGKVQKGDRLVSSDIPGVAMVGELDKMQWWNQVGRALESKDTDGEGVIEIVVGAK